MSIRPILTVPDSRLKQRSTPVEGVNDDLRALMDDMLETMYAAPGIGLAAVQVGVPKRVIVMDICGEDEEPQPRFFVNPVLSDPSDVTQSYEEGCLSVPDVYEAVDRPDRVRVQYLDYDGAERDEIAEGTFAVCIQHEMDHLEGVLFIDHLSRLKRQRAIQKVKKAAKDKAASDDPPPKAVAL